MVISEVPDGRSHPLGPTVLPGGTNVSLYAKDATGLEILLFDGPEAKSPSQVVSLDAGRHRTGHYWHAFLPVVGCGQVYGYRAHGPRMPEKGILFDPAKLLLDPYARAVVVPDGYDRKIASGPGDTTATAMRSVVTACPDYDWEGDRPPKHAWADTVIYEMHVGGFTKHPSSGVAAERRGTYAGVVDRIPYLEELGVTAVQLMPVFAFDAQDAPAGLTNYWGYSPVSFFAPHPAYAVAEDPCAVIDEFRDMVKALHQAGIEVILDVVYNHTAEYDESGPTFCFRGLANDTYYLTDEVSGSYLDFTGCGNTVRANHPVVQRMIVDSLRYWVEAMHVDGFRFDLASILSRDKRGNVLEDPPVLIRIDTDPVLASTKLIAEAWDAGGLEQVGRFVGDRWKELNGHFRDDVRRFLRGDGNTVLPLKRRLLASPDLYRHKKRGPEESINFVTCHDGFTLNDLVSYDAKHNEANAADAASGSDYNYSWNHGVEGPTDDPVIEALRNRQVRNYLAITLLSLGTPMLLMGDEVRRTQQGNNNAYCLDSELSYFDWRDLERHADVLRFTRRLIHLRLHLEPLDEGRDLSLEELLETSRIRWHGVHPDAPDLSQKSHSLAFSIHGSEDRRWRLYAIWNAWKEPLTFELPAPAPAPASTGTGTGTWLRLADTALPPPQDVCAPGEPTPWHGAAYRAEAHSVVLFASGVAPEEIP